MAEYIDKKEAAKVLAQIAVTTAAAKMRMVAKCINAVELIPAADVAPVVHGKWEVVKVYGKTALYRCTACKAEMIDYMGREEYHQYCHICGAKMDLEG